MDSDRVFRQFITRNIDIKLALTNNSRQNSGVDDASQEKPDGD
ncbi:MAG: hypothetical protein WBN31_03575 [Gammaproteobacteria bacterium]